MKQTAWALLLAGVVCGTPIYVDSGSVTVGCFSLDGLPDLTVTATGPNASASCPAGYIGNPASGSTGNLDVSGNISGLFTRVSDSIAFSRDLVDSITPVGGIDGSFGSVIFTLSYAGVNLAPDNSGGFVGASLLFNGSTIWTDGRQTSPSLVPPATDVVTLAEPIVFGQPFSYEANVSINGFGGFWGASSALQISSIEFSTTQVPEPGTAGLAGVILLAFFWAVRRR